MRVYWYRVEGPLIEDIHGARSASSIVPCVVVSSSLTVRFG